ncbi:hisitidine kinase [Bacillus licheniformis WX-02]|nr:hisitidine kinase [Bacillus licheniformis WX-02]
MMSSALLTVSFCLLIFRKSSADSETAPSSICSDSPTAENKAPDLRFSPF